MNQEPHSEPVESNEMWHKARLLAIQGKLQPAVEQYQQVLMLEEVRRREARPEDIAKIDARLTDIRQELDMLQQSIASQAAPQAVPVQTVSQPVLVPQPADPQAASPVAEGSEKKINGLFDVVTEKIKEQVQVVKGTSWEDVKRTFMEMFAKGKENVATFFQEKQYVDQLREAPHNMRVGASTALSYVASGSAYVANFILPEEERNKEKNGANVDDAVDISNAQGMEEEGVADSTQAALNNTTPPPVPIRVAMVEVQGAPPQVPVAAVAVPVAAIAAPVPPPKPASPIVPVATVAPPMPPPKPASPIVSPAEEEKKQGDAAEVEEEP